MEMGIFRSGTFPINITGVGALVGTQHPFSLFDSIIKIDALVGTQHPLLLFDSIIKIDALVGTQHPFLLFDPIIKIESSTSYVLYLNVTVKS